jgi:hypothetical protein
VRFIEESVDGNMPEVANIREFDGAEAATVGDDWLLSEGADFDVK